MRIDLPGCSFKNCKYCSDCNCINQNKYETCDFRAAEKEVEVLNTIIKKDCGMLPNYEAYLGNKVRKEFAELVDKDIEEKLSNSIKEQNPHLYLIHQIIKDRLKEMVGEE